jgi:hypothetical protein
MFPIERKRMTTLDSLRTLLALATLASGCASARDGYVYDRTASGKGSLVFQDARSTHGGVVAQLSNGERCTGNFNTIPDAVEIDDENRRIDREETQVGRALLQCGAQHVVRCDFHRDHVGTGTGQCSDTAGHRFDLYF